MTKEENIATLNEHLEHWKRLLSEKICDQSEGEKTIDALQNAIKALEQEPCEDAISRQAVLDALDKSKYSNEFCEEHHIDWSINLGMAHIVVNELKTVAPQHCVDAVSRQAVIDTLTKTSGIRGDALKALYDLPSVTPQPKMGKWEKRDVRGQRVDCCSVCGLSNGTIYEYNYCPNCGAKMENEI